MGKIIIPKKLKQGSHIRVVAPARSMGIVSQDVREVATKSLTNLGFIVSFADHVDEVDQFNSSSVKSRAEDIHQAFSDKQVDGIFTAIGGYNSNQLLDVLDYTCIANNPKIFCGFSDITAVANAITAKTGLVTYSGPHFSTFGMEKGLEYTVDYCIKALVQSAPFTLSPSDHWSDDQWYLDQENRKFVPNEGYWVLQKGYGYGRLVGGHLRSLVSLQGTAYWPELQDSLLFIEEDAEINPQLFDRLLQSLTQQFNFDGVRGILIGRFQKKTEMTRQILQEIVTSKPALDGIPIVANVDFGHTTPIVTLPIGGVAEVDCADYESAKIRLIEC